MSHALQETAEACKTAHARSVKFGLLRLPPSCDLRPLISASGYAAMSQADPIAPAIDLIDEMAPHAGSHILYANAMADHRLVGIFSGHHLACETHNKSQYDKLRSMGLATDAQLFEKPATLGLLRITRDRIETLGLIHAMNGRLAAQSPILVMGENDEGIRTVERLVEQETSIVARQSKRHARCFRFAAGVKLPDDWRRHADALAITEGIVSQAGLFAHDRLDAGSELLIAHLPDNLKGHSADFGCGWGALSIGLIKSNPQITSLDLIDVDRRAIELATNNIAHLGRPLILTPLWADIAAGEVKARAYDVIVMNPPFHADNRPDPAIGAAFFAAASKALKPGGLLFAVANRKMPYEPQLKSGFRNTKLLFEGEGYKVIRAMR
jgi:16S rRNA (guanine1207-N2)-methyltransferase